MRTFRFFGACVICSKRLQDYIPRKTCSMRCRSEWFRRIAKPIKNKFTTEAAQAVRMKQSKARIEALAREQFGPLTAREIALFNYAAKMGYRKGYSTGRYRLDKARRAA